MRDVGSVYLVDLFFFNYEQATMMATRSFFFAMSQMSDVSIFLFVKRS